MKEVRIEASFSNLRLDQAIAALYPDISRSEAERLIEGGFVLYNGKAVKKRERVQEGALLQITMPPARPSTVIPEKMSFSILYEDESLLVINKPPHLVVHPAHGNWSGTVANGLVEYLTGLQDMDPMRPGIVHRLDKDTSGVLVVAKNQEAVFKLSRQFHDRRVRKRYEAILVGELTHPERVMAPIGRDPKDRKKMASVLTGKEAISLFTPIKTGRGLTLASIEIETGRTHQIRVHAALIRHPVLGDSLYGMGSWNVQWCADRQMLHCAEMEMAHPVTSERLCFKAPLLHDMNEIIEKM